MQRTRSPRPAAALAAVRDLPESPLAVPVRESTLLVELGLRAQLLRATRRRRWFARWRRPDPVDEFLQEVISASSKLTAHVRHDRPLLEVMRGEERVLPLSRRLTWRGQRYHVPDGVPGQRLRVGVGRGGVLAVHALDGLRLDVVRHEEGNPDG